MRPSKRNPTSGQAGRASDTLCLAADSEDTLIFKADLQPPSAKPNGGSEATPNRPTIRVARGELPRIVDEIESALIGAEIGLYQRDGRIVAVHHTPAKTRSHRPKPGESETPHDTTVIQILERGEHALMVDAASAAIFERYDARKKTFIPDDPPGLAVRALRERGQLRLPVLHGVVTAPTMRPDGSILSKRGYDHATGLLFDPRGVEFPKIPDRPTLHDAKRALATIDLSISAEN
jgi:hypothetical protein